jgi:hypothetical protein
VGLFSGGKKRSFVNIFTLVRNLLRINRRNNFYAFLLTSQTQQERDKQTGRGEKKNKGTGFLAVPAAVM